MYARSKETNRLLELVRWEAGANASRHPETREILDRVCFTEQHVDKPHVHNGRDLLIIKDGDWIVKDPEAGYYPMTDELVREHFAPVEKEILA